jgi:hypothetical protein
MSVEDHNDITDGIDTNEDPGTSHPSKPGPDDDDLLALGELGLDSDSELDLGTLDDDLREILRG